MLLSSLWIPASQEKEAKIIRKDILKLAIPSILAGITIPLVGMADTAVAGRLGSASHIAAIALGSTMFDWLYWNLSFLRTGTSGLTAQAYGRGDFKHCVRLFTQSVLLALILSMAIWLIQKPFANLFFAITPTNSSTMHMALQYFFIRVWAAPAALSLFSIRGWFLGMQNSIGPMIIDIVVNVLNVFISIYLALHVNMGVAGIAWGTVIAQYCGLFCAFVLLWIYFRQHLHHISLKEAFRIDELKSFFSINANLFIRSFCILLIYSGFNMLAARFGDTELAIASIMMKLLLLYSYFIDGFAYAGEALVGRFIGEAKILSLKLCIKLLFYFCLIIGVISTAVYILADDWMLRVITSVPEVLQACSQFVVWLYVMPFISCIAFTWDGIFIGATASRAIRNAMFYSVAAFYLSYFLLKPWLGFQSLWIAYAAHLIARSVAMTCYAKKHIYGKIRKV